MKRKATVRMISPGAQQSGAEQPGSIATAMRKILGTLGEDPSREGLVSTPERYEKAMRFLLSGYATDLDHIVNGAVFTQKVDEMVIVRDIEFFSMCEHHMLPFFGKVHVAYLPKDKVIGLSKIPRIVNMFARRLQLQERLTQQIASALESAIAPRGVAVLAEGRHLCMMMRGVEKQHSGAITSTMLGAFRQDKATRDEFLSLVSRPI